MPAGGIEYQIHVGREPIILHWPHNGAAEAEMLARDSLTAAVYAPAWR